MVEQPDFNPRGEGSTPSAASKDTSIVEYMEAQLPEVPEIQRAYWHLVGLLPTPNDDEACERQRMAIIRLMIACVGPT